MSIDGNDIESIMNALSTAETVKGKPTCIIAKTVKGKGVSFMENSVEWHGKAINDEEYKKAIEELTANKIDFTE
jgi:transketolase